MSTAAASRLSMRQVSGAACQGDRVEVEEKAPAAEAAEPDMSTAIEVPQAILDAVAAAEALGDGAGSRACRPDTAAADARAEVSASAETAAVEEAVVEVEEPAAETEAPATPSPRSAVAHRGRGQRARGAGRARAGRRAEAETPPRGGLARGDPRGPQAARGPRRVGGAGPVAGPARHAAGRTDRRYRLGQVHRRRACSRARRRDPDADDFARHAVPPGTEGFDASWSGSGARSWTGRRTRPAEAGRDRLRRPRRPRGARGDRPSGGRPADAEALEPSGRRTGSSCTRPAADRDGVWPRAATWSSSWCRHRPPQNGSMRDRGMTPEQVRARTAAQLPLRSAPRMADVLLDNEGTLEELDAAGRPVCGHDLAKRAEVGGSDAVPRGVLRCGRDARPSGAVVPRAVRAGPGREGHRRSPDEVVAASRAVFAGSARRRATASCGRPARTVARGSGRASTRRCSTELGLPSEDGLRDSLYASVHRPARTTRCSRTCSRSLDALRPRARASGSCPTSRRGWTSCSPMLGRPRAVPRAGDLGHRRDREARRRGSTGWRSSARGVDAARGRLRR